MPTVSRAARIATVVTAACTLAVVLGLLLAVRAGHLFAELATGSELRQSVLAPAFGVAAILVLRGQPANRFGWLLLTEAVLNAVTVSLVSVVDELLPQPGLVGTLAEVLAPVAASIWLPAVGFGLGWIALLYPTGKLPSRRWRPVLWLAAFGLAALSLGGLFSREFLVDVYPGLAHPYAPGWETAPVAFVGLIAIVGAGVTSVVGLVVRWWRAEPPQRGQLGWFLVALLGLFVTALFEVGWLLSLATTVAFPLCLAAAVLRHGWFDGDLLLSRTVGYALVSLLIVGVFAFGVGVLGRTLGGAGIGAVVAAVAVAVFLAPVREAVQRITDRAVYGERRDPYTAMTRLGERLAAAPHPDDVPAAVVETVRRSLRVPHAAVFFPGDSAPAAEAGERPEICHEVPLHSAGSLVATLVVGLRPGQRALDVADTTLLSAFSAQVGPAVAAVQLTHDLRRSRERLVLAREEERRRLRHDLHDGLGPALAGMALGIGAAARTAQREGSSLADLLGGLEGEARSGLNEVRRIVHDLRPAALDELGLMAALRQHAEAVTARDGGLKVTVSGPEELDALPAAVEVAAYRIVMEAVTNTVRHARAHDCRVSIDLGTSLTIRVVDDGVGLPQRTGPAGGVGLASMAERAAELGGTFDAATAGGTVITAVLPVSAPAEPTPRTQAGVA
ncbi:hypothetical protein Pth03_19620 [Planotetraspora thailandica]|uniref:histidine kinase n=1 Tax=Planotetraspora thailandica TaxID=487172 RepID=A0A8J3UYH5_9ACTN|nr:sensor histidine kinase [Planotetraspora thailandica]GII53573.1 hypothetical protein Pth03_19620 [Planotetraspora thailandica]